MLATAMPIHDSGHRRDVISPGHYLMARFEFRLETVYKYRQHLLKQSQQILARLVAEEHLLLAAIDQCYQQLKQYRTTPGQSSINALQCNDAHRQQIWQHLQTLEQQLEVVRTERSLEQQRLVERMQERDVLEKLRSRHYERYRSAELLTQQNQLDQLALRSYAVNRTIDDR